MRILVVSDLPPFVIGGAEFQAARLITEWLEEGHEVICIGRRMAAESVRIGHKSVPVRKIRYTVSLGRLMTAATYMLSLAYLLLRYRAWADVVYTRFLGEAAVTASVLKSIKLLRIPLVATPASSSSGGDLKYIQSIPCSDAAIRLLDANCDAINLIAPGMAAELEGAGFGGGNFTRIPNGIPVLEPPSPRPPPPLRLLAVGRLTEQKGFDILLRALARISIPDGTKLAIVGDGPDKDALISLGSDLGLAGTIEWLGELSEKGVRAELNAANIFVLPSRYEGLSNAGLEAMERGLPILISQCGGLDTYISEDMGWTFPVENEASLALVLAKALDTPPRDLERMGSSARALVQRNFDIRSSAGRYIELFRSLSRKHQ